MNKIRNYEGERYEKRMVSKMSSSTKCKYN